MPISYTIDNSKCLIRTKCVGHVTKEEALEHLRTLENDLDSPGCLNVLLDLTEVTALPQDARDLLAIADAIGRILKRVRFYAGASVVTDDHLYGITRMFTAFARIHFTATHVFRTLHNAEQWLDSFPVPEA